jgi:hypothetical protein
MWIFLNDAMISVVEHRDGGLLARARIEGDLERVFGSVKVSVTPRADYHFRCTVTTSQFKDAMSRAIDRIDYDNFKSSVADDARHDAYMRAWQVMLDEQERRQR